MPPRRPRVPAAPPPASDLFTDRVGESEAFARSLAAHRVYLDSDDATDGLRNVLTYYGVGGIGKTALSRRLESWFLGSIVDTEWGAAPATPVAATARIDLHNSTGNLDMVSGLLSVRRALGGVRKRWPAFDVAFTAYWSSIRPGEPLPDLASGGLDFAESAAEAIKDLAGLVGVPFGGLATESVRKLADALRRRNMRRSLFANHDDYPDLLERCTLLPRPDDMHPELLAELADLLDREMREVKDPLPMVVTFIDTFERITAPGRRVDESTLNSIVWNLPLVLFVITGRDLVKWYDESRTKLELVGPAVWPGLVPGCEQDPRQHRVGYLSPEDTRLVIARGRERHRVTITEEVAEGLVESSGGLPQYLDLALALARTRERNGGPPITVDDVSGSLGDLVERVLEDVPPDEQRVIRAGALFPKFNEHIVAAAAGVDTGCALRAIERAVIETRDDNADFPYTMHDAIREAVRSAGHRIRNGWAEADWREAGERGLGAIRAEYAEALREQRIDSAIAALGLAIRLVCDEEVTVGPAVSPTRGDWLAEAITIGPAITGLRQVLPSTSDTTYGRAIIDFVTAKAPGTPWARSVELLTPIYESEHPLSLGAGRHRGYVLRNKGEFDLAIASFAELVERAPSDLHRYQHALTMASGRRFRDAQRRAHDLPDERRRLLLAHISRGHGLLMDYLTLYETRIAVLRQTRRIREELEYTGVLHRFRVLDSGPIPSTETTHWEDAATRAGNLSCLSDQLLVRALSDPSRFSVDRSALDQLITLEQYRSGDAVEFRSAMMRAALGFYSGDRNTLLELGEDIARRIEPRGHHWIPIEALLTANDVPIIIPPTQWLEPYETVQQRWVGIFDNWARLCRANPS